MKNNLRAIFSALFGIAVFLFWLLGYPEALNYQEQNQLFLTTTDYFILRMAVPGGLADYVSEFIVQFYYVPWLGALLIGIMYAVMQWIRKCFFADKFRHFQRTPKVFPPFFLPLHQLYGFF